MNVYNYAENEPIANIDLWGTQAVPANALQYLNTTGKQTLNTLKSEISKKLDVIENVAEKAATGVKGLIVQNAPSLMRNVEILDAVGSSLTDASILTTVGTGGASAEITVPLAGAGGIMQGAADAIKGVVSYAINDESGKKNANEDFAKKLLEIGENAILDKMPLSKPVRAASEMLADKANPLILKSLANENK